MFKTDTLTNELLNPAWVTQTGSAVETHRNDFPSRNIAAQLSGSVTGMGSGISAPVSLPWASDGGAYGATQISNGADSYLTQLNSGNPSDTDQDYTLEVSRHASQPGVELSPLTLVETERLAENKATNPRFKSTAGDVEVRRNLTWNPGAATTDYYTTWSGVEPGANELSVVSASWSKSGKAVRSTWSSVSSPASGDLGCNLLGISLTPGGVYTASFYMRYSDELTTFNGQPTIYTGATVTHIEQGYIPIGAYADKVVKCYATFVCPDPIPTDNFRLIVSLLNGANAGCWMEISMTDLYPGEYDPNREWFSGSYSPDPDLQPVWVGTENASQSYLRGFVPTSTYSDASKIITYSTSQGAAMLPTSSTTSDNGVSLAGSASTLSGQGVTFTKGKWVGASCLIRVSEVQTGTLSAYARSLRFVTNSSSSGTVTVGSNQADNTEGVYPVQAIAQIPSDATWAILQGFNGARYGNAPVYIDNLLIVEGDSEAEVQAKLALGFFDGDNPNDPNRSSKWSGTANQSSSILYVDIRKTEAVNLATNPRFSKTEGAVEVRRNYLLTPVFSISSEYYKPFWVPNNLFTYSNGTEGLDVSLPIAGAINDQWLLATPHTSIPASNGEQWSATFVVRNTGTTTISLRLAIYPSNGSSNVATPNGVDRVINPGETKRLAIDGYVMPAGTTNARMIIWNNSVPGYSSFTILDNPVLEKTPVAGDLFSGSYSQDPDLQPVWVGAENASQSYLRGFVPTNMGLGGHADVYSSTTKGVAVYPRNSNTTDTSVFVAGGNSDANSTSGYGVTFIPGKWYGARASLTLVKELSGSQHGFGLSLQQVNNKVPGWAGVTLTKSTKSPNAPGTYLHELVWQCPADAIFQTLRVFNGSSNPSDVVYWDNLVIVEGATEEEVQAKLAKGFFDGNHTPDGYYTRWLGDVNDSQSVLTSVDFSKNTKYVKARSRSANTTTNGQPIKDWITFTAPSGGLDVLMGASHIPETGSIQYGDIDFYKGPYQQLRPDFTGDQSSDTDFTPSWITPSDAKTGSKLTASQVEYTNYSYSMAGKSAFGLVVVNDQVYSGQTEHYATIASTATSSGVTSISKDKWYGVRAKVDTSRTSGLPCARLSVWSTDSKETVTTQPVDENSEIIAAFYVPSANVQSASIGFNTGSNEPGDTAKFSTTLLVEGDTEAEVRRKMAVGYFDGDTESVLFEGETYYPEWDLSESGTTENNAPSYFEFVDGNWEPTVKWSTSEDRIYEIGVDQGALFIDGAAYAWNGLTSVEESKEEGEYNQVFIDGRPVLQYFTTDQFSAKVEAYTAPRAFAQCDGIAPLVYGLYATQQRRKPFTLMYRTLIGNPTKGVSYAYKLHIIYNAMAEPSSLTYETMGEDINPSKMSWNIRTIPLDATVGSTTLTSAHFILDSRDIPHIKLEKLRAKLLGDGVNNPVYMTPSEIAAYL